MPHRESALLRPLGLRERKKRSARKALQMAALELVVERGLANVSIEEIAEAADVSPRTFFNYYSSKEDALFSPDITRLEVADRCIAQADASHGPFSVVRATMLEMMDDARHDLSAVQLRRQVLDREPSLFGSLLSASQSTQEHWVNSLQHRFADNADLPPGHIELIVAAAWTASGVALRLWAADPTTNSFVDVLAHQLDQLGAGLDKPLPPS